MVYFRASWATMPTSPSSREAMAEPRSRRKRDSHTRQYCSPHSPKLLHGAWKEPGGGEREGEEGEEEGEGGGGGRGGGEGNRQNHSLICLQLSMHLDKYDKISR